MILDYSIGLFTQFFLLLHESQYTHSEFISPAIQNGTVTWCSIKYS